MPQDILDIYTDYLICQNKQVTAIGIASLLDGGLSHDQITRFLNRNEYSSKDLWQYVKADVRRSLNKLPNSFGGKNISLPTSCVTLALRCSLSSAKL